MKPADSGGQRGVFQISSRDDLDTHLHSALAESPTEEAILEGYHEGLELNGLAIARGGRVTPLTLSDRLRPPGIGFGVGWIHVYPSRLFADPLAEAEQAAVSAVHTLGLKDGVAFPRRAPAELSLQPRGNPASVHHLGTHRSHNCHEGRVRIGSPLVPDTNELR